jgi:hypothetical protein
VEEPEGETGGNVPPLRGGDEMEVAGDIATLGGGDVWGGGRGGGLEGVLDVVGENGDQRVGVGGEGGGVHVVKNMAGEREIVSENEREIVAGDTEGGGAVSEEESGMMSGHWSEQI